MALSGCAAHRPLSGIPVSQLPEEWRHPITCRSGRQTIDLTLLRQTPPAEHRVDSGDVLGVYVDGILGGEGRIAAPPVYTPQDAAVPPSMGYPVTVRGDGTISLPGCGAIDVRGLTLREVEDRIRMICSGGDRPLLQAGDEQIIVSLQRPRVARVLVIRQEAGNESGHGPQPADVANNSQKRGAGRIVTLPAYRNDVLHALAETGGLPGLDAENVIYIIRGAQGRPAAVAPPPPERSVRRSLEHRSGHRALHSADGRRTGGTIQLAGGLMRDPFFDGADERESVPMWAPEAEPLEMWPGAPRTQALPGAPHRAPEAVAAPAMDEPPPRVADVPLPILPGPGVMRILGGHSSAEERFESMSDEGHTTSKLPPLPPLDPDRARAGWDARGHVSAPLAGVSQPGWAADDHAARLPIRGSRTICIPLKILPGEPLHFGEEDIILHDGDVLLVESREQDFFMTGGLLGGGQFPLPRDYDITVIDAIALVEQTAMNRPLPTRALGGVSALNQDVTVGASKVVILRKLPDGCEVPIEIDLYDAIRDPQQRLVVQAGDRIILQYTRLEAIGAFFERHILDGAIIGLSSAAVFSN